MRVALAALLLASPRIARAHGPGELIFPLWLPLLFGFLVFLERWRAARTAKLVLFVAVTAAWFTGAFLALSASLDALPREEAMFLGTVALPAVVWIAGWIVVRRRSSPPVRSR